MRPTLIRTTLFLGLPVLLAASLLGCVKREETISIAPDGGVTIRVEHNADSLAELHEGDAVPSEEAGWRVKEWKATRKDDATGKTEERYGLHAEKSFPPGAALDGSFARPGDEDAGLYLAFPTRLTIEQRPTGTYYHFYRAYPKRRSWARLNAMSKECLEGVDEHIGEKGVDAYTPDDWSFVLKRLIPLEVAKMTTFARSALRDTAPEAPQDAWLRVRTVLQAMEKELDYDLLADVLTRADGNDELVRVIEAEAEALEAEAMDQMTSALEEVVGHDARLTAEFAERYQWHKRYHGISEDLNDETFEIAVEMPGEITAANTDKLEANRATWEFDGEDLRDHGFEEFELIVTSRVTE